MTTASAEAAGEGPLDTTFEVGTPEQVRFRYKIAGPARRGLAYLIDLLVRGIVVLVIGMIAIVAAGGTEQWEHGLSGLWLLCLFVLEWGYFVFFEMLWSGQSPGKRALGLRVVTTEGHPLGFTESVLRNLLRAADFLPSGYALGLLVMSWDARFRRLGDWAAGTMVIVEERHAVTDHVRIDPPPTHEELRTLPPRPPLAGDELEALELYVRRQGSLGPNRQAELASIVAPMLARRLQVRYRDPVRFLDVLYARARAYPAAESTVKSAKRRRSRRHP
jgi:uncharacterized RDD family membrane protein YckC